MLKLWNFRFSVVVRKRYVFWDIKSIESQLMFHGSMLPPSSGLKSKAGKKPA
jgi:hypothetical protein